MNVKIRRQSGFTLIEILAVLAILGIVIFLAAGFLMRSSFALKGMGYRLTRDIQGLSLEAVKNAKIYKLSFLPDKKTYVLQEFYPPQPKPKEKDREALAKWEEEQRARQSLSNLDRSMETRVSRGIFKAFRKRELKDPVTLETFLTVRSLDDAEAGLASGKKDNPDYNLLFYPTGEMDQALIVLQDGKGNYFTLQTNPLTGRVSSEPGNTTEDEWKKALGRK